MAREKHDDRQDERHAVVTRPGALGAGPAAQPKGAGTGDGHAGHGTRRHGSNGEGQGTAPTSRSGPASRAVPRWLKITGGVVAALVLVVLACEAAGWPFLVGPMQRWLSGALERQVTFTGSGEGHGVRIGLLGSVRIDAASIEIAAPTWSKAPHMLLAKDGELRLGYRDLWRAAHGQPLRVRALHADQLDARIERLEDGRASWQFGKPKPEAQNDAAPRLPSFADLRVRDGTLIYHDGVMQADLDARFSLTEHGTADAGGRAAASGAAGRDAAPTPAADASSPASGLQFAARGTYRKLPLRVDLTTSSVLSLASGDGREVVQPVRLDAVVGHARLLFRGTASDPIHVTGLRGRFEADGPSLAALGDPIGVTLPTTGPFKTAGFLDKQGDLWKVVFERAGIGESRLAGAFTYDRRPAVPVLAGRLTGSRLLLRDLGPAVGGAPRAAAPAAAASGAAAHRVLPDRRFDLPSLKAMDANLLIDIAHVDLGTALLEPLEPLRAHLQLTRGVLGLADIDARTADGRLAGSLSLDGRNAQAAIWHADVQLTGVRLDRWLHQERKNNAPPWISGVLDGQAKVTGQGRSTAEILGSMEGGMRFHLRNAKISHVALEVAGIDLAQALGVFIKGDDALPINCNVVDLVVQKGVARPRAFVFDTRDSTVWIDGAVSFASEALDLTAIVSPKDASPFTLRTPIHVRGTFSNPSVSLEKGNVAAKVGAAALLALVNPIAAVVPFIDPGANEDAKREAAACAAIVQRENPAKVSATDSARAAAAANRAKR